MTCIVGIVHRGVVWMGGDSAGVGGWSLTKRADPKVFTAHGFIYGFTSSFRMGNLLRYRFVPPEFKGDDLMRYMATDWIDGLRACFTAGAFGKTENNHQTGGQFLVGTRGRLFSIDDDFQVGEGRSGYGACGCGGEIAIGALYATSFMQPRARVRLALEAAEAASAGVRGPFTIARLAKAEGAGVSANAMSRHKSSKTERAPMSWNHG